MDVGIYHPWLKEKGGAEKVVLEASRRSSHNVIIFTRYYNEEETFSGFQELDVVEIGSSANINGFARKIIDFEFASALTSLKAEDLDALVVSTSGIGTSITIRNHSIPLISYTHTPLRAILPEFKSSYRKEVRPMLKPVFDIAANFLGFLEKFSYRYFDRIIANSDNTKERIIRRGLAEVRDIEVINPGVDLTNTSEGASETPERYFLYPSRLRRYKRQDLAIKAFKEANTEDFKLIIAGSGQEEDYIKELKSLTDGEESIEIRTDVSEEEWRRLHKNAYAGLFLAKNEDWGITPLELMSYGKPVISVNEGGPKEQVIDGETGYLVDPDSAEIAEKIETLIHSPGKLSSMCEKAKAQARKFSWENFSSKFDNSIEEVVKNQQGKN